MPNKKEIAVEVCNIHKDFILPQNKNSTFKQTVVNIVKKNNKVTQKVLDGVSFEVNKGDFFGIVGRNGCGKSTLLKLIAGVYTPTSGHIKINGGLTPFIELGVGFNPELSGRDNVYLNGALLGFNRKQMDEMYDEIVNFAELGPFMDQKLKNYSSGMQVRLAFSIAIKAKNEILIFDEVLAVGDEAFQQKCLNVFEKYKAEKQTVILVTHDMSTVKKFCNKTILINNGKLEKIGNPQEVADKYSSLNQSNIEKELIDNNSAKSSDNLTAYISDQKNKNIVSVSASDEFTLNIRWDKCQEAKIIMVDLFKQSGEHISGFKSKTDGYTFNSNQASVKINSELAPGKYYFKISLRDNDDKDLEINYNAAEFYVNKEDHLKWAGLVPITHEWVEKKQ